jgi:ssDNA-specific exonuclease RecJ
MYFFNLVNTYRNHVIKAHSMHWNNCQPVNENDCASGADETSEMDAEDVVLDVVDPVDPIERYNSALNDIGKHMVFFKLKMSESYSLLTSGTKSISQDVGVLCDGFQRLVVDMITNRLDVLGVEWQKDDVLKRILSLN